METFIHRPSLLRISNISKSFGAGAAPVWAVKDVNLDVARGECVALVGESGSGKTTLARMMVGLTTPSTGSITLDGEDIARKTTSRAHRKALSRRIQMVFQDPHGSLNPLMSIRAIIAEPLEILGGARKAIEARVEEVLALVGLPQAYADRFPRELSGGQRQRVGIARALGPNPEILLLDEPVASLDVSIQGQILGLLKEIQTKTGITIVMIAHDLGVVRAVADRTVVMYLGHVVEMGATQDVFERPTHPYTAALIWSGTAEGRLAIPADINRSLAHEAPTAAERAIGCVFHTRCWRSIDSCRTSVDRVDLPAAHIAHCNVPLEENAGVHG
ncbi:MAG TPA: oligopeptide/dipeptide ABC transporter ATP-binding protein [Devosia sp.]|nr:oligopeptide/dipeptide ABC transporter ATP-binding protein [Devosia sp.]